MANALTFAVAHKLQIHEFEIKAYYIHFADS